MSCKGTNKRAKYKEKTFFFFYFRAKVPSNFNSEVRNRLVKSLPPSTQILERQVGLTSPVSIHRHARNGR